jgi:hypothetical protein
MAEHGKKMWVADYPQVACSVQWEPLVTTDWSCLTFLAFPKGEWYLLGRGKELPIPLWLHEALQEQEAQVVRLQRELAEVWTARERERVVLQETVQRQEMEMMQRQEALRNQRATVARLEGELAEVQAARERERVVLQETVQRQEMEMTQRQEALRNQGATVTRLEGELAEVRAASELAVEEKDLEIQNLRGELTVQLDARMQLNREFMAFQNSNGIRQVYRLKRWLRRFRR